MQCSDSITNSMDMNLKKLQETGEPGVLQSMGLQKVRHNDRTIRFDIIRYGKTYKSGNECHKEVYTHSCLEIGSTAHHIRKHWSQ